MGKICCKLVISLGIQIHDGAKESGEVGRHVKKQYWERKRRYRVTPNHLTPQYAAPTHKKNLSYCKFQYLTNDYELENLGIKPCCVMFQGSQGGERDITLVLKTAEKKQIPGKNVLEMPSLIHVLAISGVP